MLFSVYVILLRYTTYNDKQYVSNPQINTNNRKFFYTPCKHKYDQIVSCGVCPFFLIKGITASQI